MTRRIVTSVTLSIVLPLFGFLLYRQLNHYSLDDIITSITSIPLSNVVLAAVFAAASYLCLTGFDALAVRYAGYRFPYRKVALASFVSLSIGHNIGIAALSSGAIRYRFYARLGMKMGDVAKVIVFCGMAVALGLLMLGGIALTFNPDLAGRIPGLGRLPALLLGVCCFVLVASYLAMAALIKRPLKFRRWSMDMPSLPLALGQVTLGVLNYGCVSACLYFGLTALADVAYAGVITAYVIANGAALISHVPGGLGVLESMVLFLLPETDAIGALIMFRLVYFLIPLALGGLIFAIVELGLLVRKQTHGAAEEAS